ncbi:UNVERIFIED_CONTAM: putative mitochondrial protein [Sesamum latifolium]|uniref:Mitochondrial protein n=1 Tax=Sesamum latifolium TaxID=2727402 RepID=A0AAW2WAL1_9LAMI
MMHWQQRSKMHWLKDGDGNTKFFHLYASAWKKRNHISRLRDDAGTWKENETDIQGILLQYFRNIFASSQPATADLNAVLSVMQPRVTTEMNRSLADPFTEIEVKQAVFGMYPFKSPGPDGMPPMFFQKFWPIIGNDVTCSVLRILNDHILYRKMNHTHVILIPKCESPKTVAQLRPISLCNVIVRIASKCIANRLKFLMDHIVSPTQSAFIPGRLITDNVLVAFEVNHYLNSSTQIKGGCAAIKLDICKAYDRVEWAFLRGVLLRLGFHHRFVNLIMLLVTTVSYSFMLTDNTLVFCEATEAQIGTIRLILNDYERASGQVINFQKSSMVVGGHMPELRKTQLADILGVSLVPRHDRYLGLPARGGRSRGALFQGIRDWIWDRITGWNSKLLSQAGKGEKRIHWVAWQKLCQPISEGGLGFRGVKEFNQALLAKQGWRILSRSDALLSRILKARYFSHGTFWDAVAGRRPSLTWRSIIRARPLLEEGCQWAEGQGNERGCWRWRFHRLGRFTGALPTLESLGKRKADIDPLCATCGDMVESIKHTFLHCPFARQVWALSCIPWRSLSVWDQGVVEWVVQVGHEISVMDRARFFTLCWIIWQKRCKKLMENQCLDPMCAWREAEVLLENYQRVKRSVRIHV